MRARQEGHRLEGKHGAFVVVSLGRNGQGRVRSFEATSLNNFSGLWGTEAVLIVYFLLLPRIELLGEVGNSLELESP